MTTTYLAPAMTIGPRTFAWGERTYIMGIVNVSPDSFSGDGLASVESAVALARRFADEGADILDIGGQSTRPGANKSEGGFDEVPPDEEVARVVPAIQAISAALPDMPISVDTYKSEVVRAALAAGAYMLNDIFGLRHEIPLRGTGSQPPPAVGELASIAAAAQVPVCIMHNQRNRAASGDVIADVAAGLRASIQIAEAAGLSPTMLIADPGFGFGWQPHENIEMLQRLSALKALGLPLLVGTSRKSTIGTVLGGAPVENRLFGTAATVALSIANGADIVRVHDVREMKQVAMMSDAVVRGWKAAK